MHHYLSLVSLRGCITDLIHTIQFIIVFMGYCATIHRLSIPPVVFCHNSQIVPKIVNFTNDLSGRVVFTT